MCWSRLALPRGPVLGSVTLVGYRSRSFTGPAGEHADVAQLVAHHLAKVRVAGSSPVVRSVGPVRWGSVAVEWPRGEATACKAVYTGSNPVSTSEEAPSEAENFAVR